MTTSTSCPRAASPSVSSRATQIGPPNATAGQWAGVAKRMRTGQTLALARMDATRRPRLLVLNQYYWPGVEATAHLLTELCEALAADYDVRVVTGVLHGHEHEPRRAVRNGVEIVRVPSTSFERSKLAAARRQLRHVPRPRRWRRRCAARVPTSSSA